MHRNNKQADEKVTRKWVSLLDVVLLFFNCRTERIRPGRRRPYLRRSSQRFLAILQGRLVYGVRRKVGPRGQPSLFDQMRVYNTREVTSGRFLDSQTVQQL